MRKFLQGRSMSFWVVVFPAFFLSVHFFGISFWENTYDNFIWSLGWPGSVYSGVMTLLVLLILVASPFLLLFSPLFLWLIIKRKRRTIKRGTNDDEFNFPLWLILVIGVVSVLIISYLALGFLSPW